MHEVEDDDEMVDGSVRMSEGASLESKKIQCTPRCRTGDGKSITRKGQEVDLKTVGARPKDIRMFWNKLGDEVPGDLNFVGGGV